MSRQPGIIDLRTPRSRDYSRCFLKRNPFPSSAIPDEVPLITVDRERTIRHFQNVMAELSVNQTTSVTVLVGRYGSGKSHLLRVFRNSINSQLSQLKQGIVAVYVRSPGRSFQELLLYFVEDLGRGYLTDYARGFLRTYLKESRPEAAQFVYDRQVRKKLEESQLDLDEYLQSTTRLNLFRHLRQNKFGSVSNSDVVFAFLALAHPDYASVGWRWFIGESLTKDEKKLLLIENSIEDARSSYDALRNLTLLLRVLGLQSVVFLVDELEKIVTIGGLQRSQYQDDLRHLIDDNPTGSTFFFAIAPAQWDQLTKDPSALTRRLAGNVHLLDKFDPERISELIREFLKWSRTDSFSPVHSKKTFPDCSPEAAPFTDTAIEQIARITKGNISDVILLSRKALEYLVDFFGDFGQITPSLIKKVAKEEGFTS